MKVNEIIKILESLAPAKYAEDWDNPGLLVGRSDTEVSCIYVALDATEAVIENALDAGAQLLITHHPMIFSPVKKVNDQNFISRRVLTLIENHVSYYAMHTNFDVAKMAELAAERMNLQVMGVLEQTIAAGTLDNPSALGIGCVGDLRQPMSLKDCGEYVKKVFEIPNVKIFGDTGIQVHRAAICPGSGKHMTGYALSRQCDVLITGDIDHHEGIDAVSQGLMVIDAGHHGIEHIFVEFMRDYLINNLENVRVEGEDNTSPFLVI